MLLVAVYTVMGETNKRFASGTQLLSTGTESTGRAECKMHCCAVEKTFVVDQELPESADQKVDARRKISRDDTFAARVL